MLRTNDNSVVITVAGVSRKDETKVYPYNPTIEEVLKDCGYPLDADVRCAWEKCELNWKLQDGESIYVTPNKVTQG